MAKKPIKKPTKSAVKPVAKKPAPKAAPVAAKAGKVTKPQAPKARPVAELEESDNGLTFDTTGAKRSAAGVAHFAWLSKPDEKFSEGKPSHKITLVFDEEDAEYQSMLDEIMAFQETYFAFKGKKVPDGISFLRQDADKFDGKPHIVFKTKAVEEEGTRDGYTPVPIFDPNGQPTTKMYVYSEDLCRVEFQLAGFKGTGTVPMGIKPYLNAVQIIEKRSNSGGASRGSTFGKSNGQPKAGGSFGGNKGKGKARPAANDDGADLQDDDIPF